MIIVINNFFTELFSDLHELAALFNIYLFKHSDIFNFKWEHTVHKYSIFSDLHELAALYNIYLIKHSPTFSSLNEHILSISTVSTG